ncbi:MAG: ABC transporter substrate-binding protein [Candidatus Dormibacteraceae bacterium]
MAAGAVALLAAGCGSGGSGGSASTTQLEALNKKVDVTLWEGISGPPETALKAAADSFNQSQSNVTVHVVNKGSYNDLRQAVLTSLAAGSPPDMSQCYENHAAKYIQSGALADLGPYMNAKDGLSAADLKDIFPALLKDGQLGGKQYMFPFNKSTTVLYYNKDMLAAKGITSPPATWDELFADSDKFADKSGATFGVAAPQFDTWVSELYEYGGQLYDNDKNPKKAAINSAIGQQITQKWRDEVSSGAAKVVSGPGFPDQVAFQNQKSPFYIASIASYGFIVKPIGDKFKFAEAPLPAGPKGTMDALFGTNACVFSKSSADVQHGAFLFLKYFTSKDQQVAWTKASGYMPDRQSAYTQLQGDLFASNPNLGVGVGMLAKNQLFEEPPTPSSDDQRTAVATELGNAFSGNKSVKQALDDAAGKVNDLLTTG